MAHKRLLQAAESENIAGEEKRHRSSLQSVVLEAVGPNAMQKLLVLLEPMIRRVVSEEVERAIAKYLPSSTLLGSRLPSKQLERTEPTSLRLQFQNKLRLPLYTGCKIEGEHGSSIQVSLQDASTGQVILVDEESSVKLDMVVLDGDFLIDEEEDWSYEEFENHVVKEREGKRPLLTGDLSIPLKNGMGTLGELIFTDNSSWIRSRKFRLGVRLSTGCLKGIRVREAKTEAFFVRDHRGQLYKKHYPPKLNDDVWRLEKIGKDGAYHRRLCEFQINTVKDFLVSYITGPSRTREIFGTTMSTKTWDSIIEHAKTCTLNETLHVFYPDDTQTIGVVLDTIYQPLGIVRNGGSFVPASFLSDNDQVYMDRLVQEAHRDVSSLPKLPTGQNYREAYKDQSVSVQDTYQEQEVGFRSGYPPKLYDGSCQAEVCEPSPSQPRRDAHSLYESNGVTFTPGYVPYTLQKDTRVSAIGEGMKQSLFSNAFSSGTLESLFAYGNPGEKVSEQMGEDLALEESQWRYVDNFNKGRTFGLVGNEEPSIVKGVNAGPFSNAIATDVQYAVTSLSNAQNDDVDQVSLFPRAYMGWRKLKLVFKCIYFMRNFTASRRQLT